MLVDSVLTVWRACSGPKERAACAAAFVRRYLAQKPGTPETLEALAVDLITLGTALQGELAYRKAAG